MMKSIGGFNFSFNYRSYFEACDFDEQLFNEGWSANKVQQIWMLKENMNDFQVSARVWKPRITEKKSSKNLQRFSLLCRKYDRDKKDSKSMDRSYKKTRSEEIKELLHFWVTQMNFTIYQITLYLLNYKNFINFNSTN